MTPVNDPWWQVARTPKQGLIIGSAWGALALGSWALLVIDDDESWGFVSLRVLLGMLETVLAAGYLTSAVLLRRKHQVGGKSGR